MPLNEIKSEEIRHDLHTYLGRWDDDLQPLQLEVQLVAEPEVADFAARVSGALMKIAEPIEHSKTFVDYYPGWFMAKDLAAVLRDAMRAELGLVKTEQRIFPGREDPSWPWLPDRPPRESYVQKHQG